MWRVEYGRQARRYCDRLPLALRESIEAELDRLSREPFRGTRLKGRFAGLRRIRVGGLRLVYSLDEPRRIIILIAVGPRGDVYK